MSEFTAEVGDRAAALTRTIGAGVDNRDYDAVRAFIRSTADIGLSLLFIAPGSKVPVDLRTSRQRTADDTVARDSARKAGRRDWEKVKSPAGLALAASDTAVLDRYLTKYLSLYANRYPGGVPVNLAVEVGGSGLVVVDCDTREQLAAFLADAAADPDTPPTVRSPGQRGPDGQWVHRDGGHFYFTAPEGTELPSGIGAMTVGPTDDDTARYAVMWDRRYVVIPPSTRPEGAYTVAGTVHELPKWLAERIAEHGKLRADRAARARTQPADGMAAIIDAWAEDTPWSAILEPVGWVPAPRADSCGCAVWTAPGVHASPKSATAHDSGCTAGRYTETNAPLHVWTDHDRAPFDDWLDERGTSTLSKLQAVAASQYNNDLGAAMTALDLGDDLALDDDLPEDFGKAPLSGEAAGDDAGQRPPDGRSLRVTWACRVSFVARQQISTCCLHCRVA